MKRDADVSLMQISFERLPAEHADIMLSSGRSFMENRKSRYSWPVLWGAIGFGAAVGLMMEIYRRFILGPIFGIDQLPALDVLVLEFLPFFLCIFALVILRYRATARQRRETLIRRLRPGIMVDVDVYDDGIEIATGHQTLICEWPTFREVVTSGGYILLYADAFATYIPERAFTSRQEFLISGKEIRRLWRAAMEKQAERLSGAAH